MGLIEPLDQLLSTVDLIVEEKSVFLNFTRVYCIKMLPVCCTLRHMCVIPNQRQKINRMDSLLYIMSLFTRAFKFGQAIL